MKVNEATCYACGIVGSVSGAASASRSSFLLAGVGAAIGLVLGIASFCALVVPYVWWLIQVERPELQTDTPARLQTCLFIAVMLATLILAASISWFAFGLFL
jgi:hypothetical protein